jgi:hypothetical protein
MADDDIEATAILVRMPEMKLGSMRWRQTGALAIGPSNKNWDLMDWYSEKNPVSVIGWLGGNVLHSFRITLDYPNHMSYWLRQSPPDPHDLDQVGLTLKTRDGQYFVAAIATQNGKPTVQGVQPGDRLIQIDALPTKTATWGAIFTAMHGKPGELRNLFLERDTIQFTVQARVTAF